MGGFASRQNSRQTGQSQVFWYFSMYRYLSNVRQVLRSQLIGRNIRGDTRGDASNVKL